MEVKLGWSGSGVFSRIYNWVSDRDVGLFIDSTRMDAEDDGFTAGINSCLTKNGENVATANLPMGGFRHTGVGDGTARTHYASIGQMQDGAVFYAAAGGTVDVITATLSPAPSSLVDGMEVFIKASGANTSTTPTFNLNGLGAKTITKFGGTALVAGDIAAAGHELTLRYSATGTRWELLNPKKVAFSDVTGTPGTVTSITGGAGLSGGAISTSGTLAVIETINAQTGTSYTVVAGDQAKLVTFSNASAIAVTLPQATGSFAASWFADFSCLASSTGAATITPTTSTIDGAATLVLTPGMSCRVVSDGTNYQIERGMDNFGRNYAHFREQQLNNVASTDSSLTSGSYVKRTLNNTPENLISGVSLSSSQVTLPAGRYRVEAAAPVTVGASSAASRLRIRDTTTPITLLTGPSVVIATNGVSGSGFSTLKGEFTLAAQKVVELDHFVSVASCTGGTASNSGEVEVYAEIFIWKIG